MLNYIMTEYFLSIFLKTRILAFGLCKKYLFHVLNCVQLNSFEIFWIFTVNFITENTYVH